MPERAEVQKKEDERKESRSKKEMVKL